MAADEPADLSPLIAPIIAQAKIPGAAALVLRGDKIIAQGAVGVRKRGDSTAITIDDQFELCSCAKAMTATVAARLVEAGRLRWDTTLSEIFGDTVPRMDPGWHNVTVLQALRHCAGMDDHLVLLARTMLSAHGSASAQRQALTAKILLRPPDHPPGAKSVYNSTDYFVIGAALEKIAGRPWEDLMRDELFQPLGLSSGGFGPPGTPGRLDQPWGHGVRRWHYLPLFGDGLTPFDPGSPNADYPLIGSPAGLVHMSLGDWAKFVSLHLRADPANPRCNVACLKPESFALLHTPMPGQDYAGGWFTGTRPWAKGMRPGDIGRVIFHQGDNGRWNCAVWVAPEIDFAVLIACNRASMWGPVDAMAARLVKEYATPATNATVAAQARAIGSPPL